MLILAVILAIFVYGMVAATLVVGTRLRHMDVAHTLREL